ncbi:MAG: MBL fold metallo-hydrolase [Culicoidibacterales bacterium]
MLKDKKTNITFHSGLRTIGGTLIEIAYEDSRIFFDFGSEYNPALPEQPETLQQLLDAKLVTYVEHIFDPAIELTGYKQESENPFVNTAVFVSHVHLDHTKIINYLDPAIPCYTLEGTKSLLNTLNINNDFLFPRVNPVDGKNTRDIVGVDHNEIVSVGSIQVKVMPIDHDAYGACGLLIQTPDMTIAYTGDLRIHGYRPEDTFAFCEASKHCDMLIIEGVSVSFQEIDSEVGEKGDLNEPALMKRLQTLVQENPDKQMTFNYYIANVERIMQLIETCPRTVVLDAYSAYVVKQATGFDAFYYQLDDINYNLEGDKQIAFETLLQDTTRFFWQLETNAIKYIDKMQSGGIYVHSNAQPLGEFDPAYQPFIDNFAAHNIEFVLASCSGHAHPRDLISVIDMIEPKVLVPIHSFRPEKLYNNFGEVFLPEKGQTI